MARKPKHGSLIPNSDFAAARAVARWQAALSATQSVARPPVVSRRYRLWTVRPALAASGGSAPRYLLLGAEPGPELPVDASRIEDAAYALADFESIDSQFQGEDDQHLPDMESLSRFLRATGDPGQPPFAVAQHEPGKVDFEALAVAIYLLRRMWLISVALQEKGDIVAAFQRVLECRTATGIASDWPWPSDPDDATRLRLIRSWAAFVISRFCFTTIPIPDPKTGRYALAAEVGNPLQLLAITFGVSIGAVEAPVPGVYVCEYRPCGSIFVADRSRVKGAHFFCSGPCGKRYWATVNTYKKRAIAKEQRKEANDAGSHP